jgi:hypothetical protein
MKSHIIPRIPVSNRTRAVGGGRGEGGIHTENVKSVKICADRPRHAL